MPRQERCEKFYATQMYARQQIGMQPAAPHVRLTSGGKTQAPIVELIIISFSINENICRKSFVAKVNEKFEFPVAS